jgi:hypothetical protein
MMRMLYMVALLLLAGCATPCCREYWQATGEDGSALCSFQSSDVEMGKLLTYGRVYWKDPANGYSIAYFSHQYPGGMGCVYAITRKEGRYTLSFILPDGKHGLLYETRDASDVEQKLLFQLTGGKLGSKPKVWGQTEQ